MTTRIHVTDCVALACRINGIPKGQIFTRRRFQNLVQARQDAMLLARECGNSLSHIGRVMNFDHTTILHGIKAAKARRDVEWKRQGIVK